MHEESVQSHADANRVAEDFTGRRACHKTVSVCRSETKISNDVNGDMDEVSSLSSLTDAYRSVLAGIGEHPNREGLLNTPERAAKAMMFFTKGYKESAAGKVQ